MVINNRIENIKNKFEALVLDNANKCPVNNAVTGSSNCNKTSACWGCSSQKMITSIAMSIRKLR